MSLKTPSGSRTRARVNLGFLETWAREKLMIRIEAVEDVFSHAKPRVRNENMMSMISERFSPSCSVLDYFVAEFRHSSRLISSLSLDSRESRGETLVLRFRQQKLLTLVFVLI